MHGAFSALIGIELELTSKAPFWINYNKKTPPASFKKNQLRKQKVYDSFLKDIKYLYEEHINMMESKSYDTSKNAPLFVNRHGNPMSVQTYSGRVMRWRNDHNTDSMSS